MVEFYVLKIKRGDITIDDVPKFWHDKVKERLERKSKEEGE